MVHELKRNTQALDAALCPQESFDLIKRELSIGGRAAVLYFIDGMIKDEVYEKILEFFDQISQDEMKQIPNMRTFAREKIPYVEAETAGEEDFVIEQILSGPSVLLIDGWKEAAIVDTRTYPSRSVEEPSKDKTLRGSKDGFVETLISNTAMMRRRIRRKELRVEYAKAGHADLAFVYEKGNVDEKLLGNLRRKIREMRPESTSMTQQAVSEALIPPGFWNPFPRFRYTQRPDYAAAAVRDGKVIVLMDNCPAAMILPTSYFDFFRESEDYYFPPFVGTYIRLLRTVVALLSVWLIPVYVCLSHSPSPALSFLFPQDAAPIALWVQLLLLEILVDGLHLASLNTPAPLSGSLGIIGGLLLSEFAVKAQWFSVQPILLIAFVVVASLIQPSEEMAYALKFQRVALLLLARLFSFWGLLVGGILFFAAKLATKTLDGRKYLAPLIPFSKKRLIKLWLRSEKNR